MKHKPYILFLFIAFAMTIFNSCKETLDLDDETVLLIEKKSKLEKLDELYDLAFESPIVAEKAFDTFIQQELITDQQNFLSDDEINNRYTLTSLAIQLTVTHEQYLLKNRIATLFEYYRTAYESDLYNRTLLGSIPEQLKKGNRLEKFQHKINEIADYHNNQIITFEKNTKVDPRLVDKNWFGGGLAYKSDFSAMYPIQFDFVLNANKSWDYDNFFFMPAIPQIGALAGIRDEKDLNKGDIISPLEYHVYGDRILFHFHIQNTYNYETEKGKLERIWCYEFKYEINGNTLKFTEPRLLNYMFPVLTSISFDEPLYIKNYIEGFNGFQNGFTLNVYQ